MAKKHSAIVQELDLDKVEGYTIAQKKYYTSLGCKPYLAENGKVKWLRPDQHSLRINANLKKHNAKRLFSHRTVQYTHKHRHRPSFIKFIKRNWFFTLLLIIILLAVMYLLLNPQIIF